jgi:PAS domain S-box-containing protein
MWLLAPGKMLLPIAATLLIYLFTFSSLYQQFGLDVIALVIIPVVLTGWLCGFRAGVLAGLLALPLNMLLLNQVTSSNWYAVLPWTAVPAQAAAVLLGGLSGWMHNQLENLQKTLVEYGRAQATLQASEWRHRQMFEKNRAIQLLLDPENGRIVEANPAAADFYGYSLDQLQGKLITDINQLPADLVGQEMARAAAEERTYFLFPHRLASGEIRQVEVYSGPVDYKGRRLLYSVIHDITERKRVEDALKESERQYRTLIEQSNDAIYILYDGRFELINKRFSDLFGVTAAEARSPDFNFLELVAPESIPVVAERVRKVQAGQEVGSRYEFTAQTRDGQLIPLEVTVSYVDYRGGVATQGILRDITDRKRAEAALRRSEQYFRSLIENALDIISIVNARGVIRYGSPSLLRTLGYAPDELLGRRAFSFVHPDDLANLLRMFYDAREANSVTGAVEFRFRHKDGSWRTLEAIGKNLLHDPFVAGVVVNSRDVTERHQAQEALRASEERFRSLVNSMDDIIYVLDRDQRFVAVYGRWLEKFHLRPDMFLGKTFRDLGGDSAAVHEEANRRVLTGQDTVYTYDWTVQNVSFQIAKSPLRDSQGEIIGIVGVGRDITERKKAEEAIQRRTDELEALAEVSAALRAAHSLEEMLPLILEKAVGVVNGVNGSLYLVTPVKNEIVARAGYPPNPVLLGRRFHLGQGITGHVALTGEIHISEDVFQDPMAYLLPEERQQLPGVRSNICLPLRAQERVVGVLNVSLSVRHQFSKSEVRLLTAISEIAGSALDRAMVMETLEQRVTERTRELAEANQRLQELDLLKSKFVSDVSHELRTPVANLSLYLDLLQRGKPEKRSAYLTILHEQTDRLSQLIADILNLAHLEFGQDKVEFGPASLNSLVEQVIVTHRLQAETSGLKLVYLPQPGLMPVYGEESQLIQVITNLVANAINYTPSGQIRVTTGWDAASCRAYLEVLDTGMGVDQEDIPHLFDRFYRGRRTSQSNMPGTGLGLAIVKEIVDRHGGEVEVESQVNVGSIFRVWLPLAQGDASLVTGDN